MLAGSDYQKQLLVSRILRDLLVLVGLDNLDRNRKQVVVRGDVDLTRSNGGCACTRTENIDVGCGTALVVPGKLRFGK